MKLNITILSLLFTFTITSFAGHNALSKEEKEAGFQLLFDGKTLDGWEATHEDQWYVENGELIADGPRVGVCSTIQARRGIIPLLSLN